MRVKLGIPMKLFEIAHAVGGRTITAKNAIIKNISTDSRETEAGDLFIAIKGEKNDGEAFVTDARKRGGYILSRSPDHSDILHPDGRSALLSLASYYNKNLPYILYRIGITGSVGKTTTKEFLKILLSCKYITHASAGNFNNEIGLPLSILSAKRESQILIMEMGMNHRGEIKRLSECLCPNIGIITNIGTAHIGNLGSRECIAKAKLEITSGMKDGLLLVPDDEPLLECNMKRASFSLTSIDSNYLLQSDTDGEISLFKNRELYAKSPFALGGEHHRKCLLAAASAAVEIGLSPEELSLGISSISDDNIRQKVFYRENYYFYADFYNASRESVLACIESARVERTASRKSLLLGDILELGDMSQAIHHEIGNAISPHIFDNLFLFGNLINEVALGAIEIGFPVEKIFINHDLSKPEICAEQIRSSCHTGELIFMKASRAIRLERVLDCFKN